MVPTPLKMYDHLGTYKKARLEGHTPSHPLFKNNWWLNHKLQGLSSKQSKIHLQNNIAHKNLFQCNKHIISNCHSSVLKWRVFPFQTKPGFITCFQCLCKWGLMCQWAYPARLWALPGLFSKDFPVTWALMTRTVTHHRGTRSWATQYWAGHLLFSRQPISDPREEALALLANHQHLRFLGSHYVPIVLLRSTLSAFISGSAHLCLLLHTFLKFTSSRK